jgi:hypothetical protein
VPLGWGNMRGAPQRIPFELNTVASCVRNITRFQNPALRSRLRSRGGQRICDRLICMRPKVMD